MAPTSDGRVKDNIDNANNNNPVQSDSENSDDSISLSDDSGTKRSPSSPPRFIPGLLRDESTDRG